MTDPSRARAEEMLVLCQDRLRRRIQWMMGEGARRAADTDDFLGEVTLRVLEKTAALRWRDEAHFLALASRIARHIIIDRVRRPRVRRFDSLTVGLLEGRLGDPNGPTPSGDAAREEDLERMLAALEQLRDDDQRVIELRHFDDLSFQAIGEQMGRSPAAVQMLHARAVTRLGQALRR